MPTYRLGSSPLVHAPGLIAWAINAYAFSRDRAAILRVVTETWPGLQEEQVRRLLSREQAYRIEDDTLVIDVAETGVSYATSGTVASRAAHSAGEAGQ